MISLKFFTFGIVCYFVLIFFQEEEDVDAGNVEEDVDGEMADIETLNYDDLDSVSKLQKTQRYVEVMQVNKYFAQTPICKI